MEGVMDRNIDQDEKEPTAEASPWLLAVRVVALPFLLVAIVIWGAVMVVFALARGLMAAVDACLAGWQSLSRGAISAPSDGQETGPPSVARPGIIRRRFHGAKTR